MIDAMGGPERALLMAAVFVAFLTWQIKRPDQAFRWTLRAFLAYVGIGVLLWVLSGMQGPLVTW